jgi:hypothetical protein
MNRYNSVFRRDVDVHDPPDDTYQVTITSWVIGVPILEVMRDPAVVHQADKCEVVPLDRLRGNSPQVAVLAHEFKALLGNQKYNAAQ